MPAWNSATSLKDLDFVIESRPKGFEVSRVLSRFNRRAGRLLIDGTGVARATWPGTSKSMASSETWEICAFDSAPYTPIPRCLLCSSSLCEVVNMRRSAGCTC